ncbi:MAG: phosphopantetheine-binding protein [Acidimicrobiales bacterium]
MLDDDEVVEFLVGATGLERADLGSSLSLLDLGLSSFRVMQTLMQIEETFGIELSDEEVVRFASAPAQMLASLVGKRAAGSSVTDHDR